MSDQDKTQEQLIEEVVALRDRVDEGKTFQAAVLNSLVAHIAVLDRVGRIVAVNEPWLRFARENGDPDGRNIGVGVNYLAASRAASVAGDPYAAAALDGIEAVLQGGRQQFVVEYPCHSPDQQHWFLMHVTANIAEIGGAIVTHTDITERKRAEDALQKAHDELEQRVKERIAELAKANEKLSQSHDELQAIYDGMFDGLLIADFGSKRFVRANASIRQTLGYSEAELLSMSVIDIHPADDIPVALERIQARAEGRLEGPVDIRLLRKDGSILYADVVSSRIIYRGSPSIAIFFRDVTERKRAETALRQSHDELRAIYEGMPDGLLAADIETKRFVRCNAAMRRLLGYSENELLARSVMDIHPAAELSDVLNIFHALVAEKHRIGQNIPVLRKDGSIFHADITHNELLINGRRCTVGFFRDITERKTAEDALRASEERFRVTFEEAPVGMVICVGDGVITKANRAVCRISGYSPEELVGRHVRDLVHPEDRELSGLLVKRFLAGEIPGFTLEKRYLRKDGKPFWAQATTAAAHGPDGKVVFALGVVEDIDDRKRAEEALRESEEKYRTLVETSPDAVIMADLEGHVSFASARAFQMYRTENVEELLGRNPLEFLAPEDHQDFLTMLRETLEKGVTKDVGYNFLRKDGTRFFGEASSAMIRDVAGRPTGFVAIVRDITERKRAEEVLYQERRTLKHLLESSDHERHLISCEIHDGLAQQLVGAIMQFDGYKALKETNPERASSLAWTTTRPGPEMRR